MVGRQSDELQRMSLTSDPESYEACVDFSRQVGILDGLIAGVYGEVIACTKQAEQPDEIVGLWRSFLVVVDSTMKTVASLKDAFPDCGTPELYDHILDYRLAAKERMEHAMEEHACLKKTPKGLFPPMS